MSAALHYQTLFTASSTNTATVTLAGEYLDGPVMADYTISVPVDDLSSVVTYAGAYVSGMTADSATTYPTVTFRTDLLVTAAESLDAEFRGSTAAVMEGDNSTVPPILEQFRTLGFQFQAPAFASYPLEAVIGVSYAAAVTTSLSVAVGAPPAPTSAENSAPVNLFEQLLGSDKIGLDGLSDANGTGSASFVEGDSISLYVAYTLTKTREFGVDQSGLTGATHLFTLGGVTINNAEKLTETSDSVVKNVRWQFVQGAPK